MVQNIITVNLDQKQQRRVICKYLLKDRDIWRSMIPAVIALVLGLAVIFLILNGYVDSMIPRMVLISSCFFGVAIVAAMDAVRKNFFILYLRCKNEIFKVNKDSLEHAFSSKGRKYSIVFQYANIKKVQYLKEKCILMISGEADIHICEQDVKESMTIETGDVCALPIDCAQDIVDMINDRLSCFANSAS